MTRRRSAKRNRDSGSLEAAEEAGIGAASTINVDGRPRETIDRQGLKDLWAANRDAVEAERLRAFRAKLDEEAPIRILHEASHWQSRHGVTYAMDFALRLIAVVAMLKRRRCEAIELPSGKVARIAQRMLDEAWKDGLRARGRIAEQFEEFCSLADEAGEINKSVDDESAWRPDPNPPRDSVHYFRIEWSSSVPNFFGDIARAAGISYPNLETPSELDLLAERLNRRTQASMEPLSAAEVEDLSLEFRLISSMPYGEESVRRLRHASERAGRGTLGFDSAWLRARSSDQEVVLAEHSDRVVFTIGRQRPPLLGDDLMTSMRILVEHAELDRMKFVTSSDVDGFFYRHHFLEFVSSHAFVPIPGRWTIKYASGELALLDSDTNAANPSTHRDFCYRFAKAAERVVHLLTPRSLPAAAGSVPRADSKATGVEGEQGHGVRRPNVHIEDVGVDDAQESPPPWSRFRKGGSPVRGWIAIAETLGKDPDDSFRRRMKRLNKQTNGPIGWCGRTPEVDEGELVAWIEDIAARSAAQAEERKRNRRSITATAIRGDLSLGDESMHLERRPGARGIVQDRQRSTNIDTDRPSRT